MMLITLLALGLPSLLYGFYAYFCSLRRFFADMPSIKRDFFWGNMLVITKYLKPGRHPDYGFLEMYEELGQPEIYFMDVQPIHRLLVVCSPALAEQLTKPSSTHPYSAPKSYTMMDYSHIVGKTGLIVTNGEDWKATRKRFQPGFQPQHLKTLLPLIINDAQILMSNILEKTQHKEPFELARLTQNFTLDVISSIVFGRSFKAQNLPENQGVRAPDGLLTAFMKITATSVERGDVLGLLNLHRIWQAARYGRILDKRIAEAMADVVANLDSTDVKSRAVLHLALKGRELTPAVLQEASDQVRNFIFAGYETTSTTIQWMAYYLSLESNSATVNELIAEHDRVLGRAEDQDSVGAMLLTDPLMPHTDAFIKETLRLQPPGGTARWIPPPPVDKPFQVMTSDGKAYLINNSPIYICHKIIHTTTKVWGPDASIFRPGRWLDKEYMANLPVGAFRPFERGPRDCIGQGLAYLEAKIALCLMARRFVFQKYTPPGEKSDLGDVWNIWRLTPCPNDGMRMIVRER